MRTNLNKQTINMQQNKLNDPMMSAALILNALEMFKVRKAFIELEMDETITAEQIMNAKNNWNVYLDSYCYAIKMIDTGIN